MIITRLVSRDGLQSKCILEIYQRLFWKGDSESFEEIQVFLTSKPTEKYDWKKATNGEPKYHLYYW